jgi:protein-tyrosine phosphatase
MVDIHCHILPGVDDGPPDWATTLEMCRLASDDGIRHIVATPHANSRYAYNREQHQILLNELQTKVPQLTFSLGCDFHVSYENVETAIAYPRRFSIGESRFLLAELSDFGTPAQMKELLFRLHCAGFTTVITHPERNPILAQYRTLAAELVDMGSLLQITGDSLLGAWGRGTRKLAETYIKEGLVSVISSDAHDTRRRIPVLSKARKAAAKLVGEAAAQQMVETNPQAICTN